MRPLACSKLLVRSCSFSVSDSFFVCCTGGFYCCIRNNRVACCLDLFLRNQNIPTYGAMFALSLARCCAGGGYSRVDYFCVACRWDFFRCNQHLTANRTLSSFCPSIFASSRNCRNNLRRVALSLINFFRKYYGYPTDGTTLTTGTITIFGAGWSNWSDIL